MGKLMGYVEIIHKDGSGIRIDEQGVKEATFDICSKCGEVKDMINGFTVGFHGLSLLWVCVDCKGVVHL